MTRSSRSILLAPLTLVALVACVSETIDPIGSGGATTSTGGQLFGGGGVGSGGAPLGGAGGTGAAAIGGMGGIATTTTGGMGGDGGLGGLGEGGSGGMVAMGGAGGGMNGPLMPGDLAPDFSLLDVNPNSPTANQVVSPRNHLGRVSGWYFGHST